MMFPMVFTDLDGTLLDHSTYSFQAAQPILDRLTAAKVPVVATTSKTQSEVVSLYKKLNMEAPFIIENGAAVFIPKQYFPKQPQDSFSDSNFWIKRFSKPREKFIHVVNQLKPHFGHSFTHFDEMSLQAIVDSTGLSASAAGQAKQRQYGEPVLWTGKIQEKHDFIKAAIALGANVLEGGRFIHICDHCDKGQAMNWLAGEYQHQFQLSDITVLALGDSGNDSAMLEAADIAIQVKSPTHDFPKLHLSSQTTLYQTTHYGPEGWSEALSKLIDLSQIKTHSIVPNGGQ